jgi:glucose/arabinose dehydrogenase
MRGSIVALLAGFAGLGLAMVAAAAPAPSLPADAARGERLFNTGTCAGCHGAQGVYPVGPSMVGPPMIGPKWKYGDDPLSLFSSIHDGRPLWMKAKGGMNLSDDQIRDIVAYIKYRQATATPEERAIALQRTPAGPPAGVVNSAVESFRVERVANIYLPYAFDFLPDGRILVSETGGPLRVIQNGKLLTDPVAGAPMGDTTGMDGWMSRANLSVAVHPNFKSNGWVYLLTARHAAKPAPTGAPDIATIWRGRLVGNRWLDNRKILEFPMEGPDSHRMKFDKQGYLYVGTVGAHGGYTGVDGEKQPAQDLTSPEGKILRIRDDGSVPPDNPFVNTPGAYPYIWSLGHREPSGLTFDGHGELWNVEDGEHGGDELNHVRKGHNYGWPAITWGHPYLPVAVVSRTDHMDMEQPVAVWTPSPAVSDVEYYGGSAFPAWRGSFFVGTMKQRDLYRVTVDGDREILREVVLHNLDRIRDIATGPDGLLYLLTDSGDLLRLVPAGR